MYRGTSQGSAPFNVEKFFDEILEPARQQSEDGAYPMHLGLLYFKQLGRTVLSTEPLKHRVLGMDHYCKVTSPLRRYGDMILHWQIEAALREEARTGRNLVTQDKGADRPRHHHGRATTTRGPYYSREVLLGTALGEHAHVPSLPFQ